MGITDIFAAQEEGGAENHQRGDLPEITMNERLHTFLLVKSSCRSEIPNLVLKSSNPE
jgi:hypothetical protein